MPRQATEQSNPKTTAVKKRKVEKSNNTSSADGGASTSHLPSSKRKRKAHETTRGDGGEQEKEQATKKRRPDRAERMKQRSVEVETIIKSSLRGKIIGGHRTAIIEAIERRVEACSRRIVNASVLINLLVRHLFHTADDVRTVQIPELWGENFVRQAMLGTQGCPVRTKCADVERMHQQYPDLLHNAERSVGDANIYTLAARKLRTNIKNHLWINLPARISRYIRMQPDTSKDQQIAMLFAIHGWQAKRQLVPLTEQQAAAVELARSILGLHEGARISKSYLKDEDMLPNMLRFSVHVARLVDIEMERVKEENEKKKEKGEKEEKLPRLFNLLPLCRTKAHFITIDNDGLHGILTEVGLVTCNADVFRSMKEAHWGSVLDIPQILSTKTERPKRFSFTVDTDGVALNVNTRAPELKIMRVKAYGIGPMKWFASHQTL